MAGADGSKWPERVEVERHDAGLEAAFLLDGRGGGTALDWAGVRRWRPEDGTLWLHLDRKDPAAQSWLEEESGLPETVVRALLNDETRPRFTTMHENGEAANRALMVLRGVNLNPGAEPEDLVSLRIWAESARVVTSQHRHVHSVGVLRVEARRGVYPLGPGDLITRMVTGMVGGIEPVVQDLEDQLDALEEDATGEFDRSTRAALVDVRRSLVAMRRYLAPQREVIHQVRREPFSWLTGEQKVLLGEAQEEMTRFVESLDAARERVTVVQEELSARVSEQINQRLYVFSLVAAIFLPLTLLTGLLGSNVNGIPWADSALAFPALCVAMGLIALAELWLLRRLRLL